jgi:hypothetical protein
MIEREAFVLFLLILCLVGCQSAMAGIQKSSLMAVLPDVDGFVSEDSPQTYYPETLFEYINGAAEIYLSYDFRELIVAQYNKKNDDDTVSVEIYDMGNHRNSFGIYSAERFPDSQFISLGTQGYLEEGSLNFLVGRYYVKLLCFDCEEKSNELLQEFCREIVEKVENKPGFPELLEFLPKEGRLPNTEKFILRNFLGYRFLHHGYVASYEVEGQTFDCFVIEAQDPQEAVSLLQQYLDAKKESMVQKKPLGFLVKDRYYHNIYVAPVNKYICGVMKIKEGYEKMGEDYLRKLSESLGK